MNNTLIDFTILALSNLIYTSSLPSFADKPQISLNYSVVRADLNESVMIDCWSSVVALTWSFDEQLLPALSPSEPIHHTPIVEGMT